MRYTLEFINSYGYQIVNKFDTWEETMRFIEAFNLEHETPFKLICKKY